MFMSQSFHRKLFGAEEFKRYHQKKQDFINIIYWFFSTVKKCASVRMLPMECQFLNKTALVSATGPLPQPVKHFALKRKPKSAILRAELLQKCKCLLNVQISTLFHWVCSLEGKIVTKFYMGPSFKLFVTLAVI